MKVRINLVSTGYREVSLMTTPSCRSFLVQHKYIEVIPAIVRDLGLYGLTQRTPPPPTVNPFYDMTSVKEGLF